MAQVVKLKTLFAEDRQAINPFDHLHETFALYSIPAYDTGKPEIVSGKEVGSSKVLLKDQDVLLSRIVPHIRRCWIVNGTDDHRRIGSGEWIVFRIPKNVDPKYLRYFFLTEKFGKKFLQTVRGVGGSLLRADPKQVGEFEIPLPPLHIQKKIVAILGKADNLRQKDKQLLEHYNKLTESIFYDMFGDPVRNEKSWEVLSIRDVVTEVKYGTSKPADEVGKYPYLRMNNITYGGDWDFSDLKHINLSDNELDKYLLQRDDLVFNRTNSKDLVGKTAVYKLEKQMAIAGYLIRVRTNEKANTDYISGFLNSKQGKDILRGMCKNIIGMANINAQELQDIRLPVPPRGLQEQFKNRIAIISGQKQFLREQLKLSEGLFQSLLQKAFKGELVKES